MARYQRIICLAQGGIVVDEESEWRIEGDEENLILEIDLSLTSMARVSWSKWAKWVEWVTIHAVSLFHPVGGRWLNTATCARGRHPFARFAHHPLTLLVL